MMLMPEFNAMFVAYFSEKLCVRPMISVLKPPLAEEQINMSSGANWSIV
jgi:hypothetical protein